MGTSLLQILAEMVLPPKKSSNTPRFLSLSTHSNRVISHRGIKEENPSSFENELAINEDMDEAQMFNDADMEELIGEVQIFVFPPL